MLASADAVDAAEDTEDGADQRDDELPAAVQRRERWRPRASRAPLDGQEVERGLRFMSPYESRATLSGRNPMRYSFAGLTEAMVFCAGISVFAQLGTPPPTKQEPNGRLQPSEMVISGCLKSFRSDGGEVTIYTLEGRKPTNDSYPPSLNAVPEDATAPHTVPITPANTVYSLSALALVNLSEHVGQKVELTGKMQPTVRNFGAVGTTGTAGAQAQAEFAAPSHSRFEVSAVKMLSTTCE